MTHSSKKKKQSINRELFIGGGAIVLMFPLITLAIIGSLSGVFVGFILLTFSEVSAITALTMFVMYVFFTIGFGIIFWRICQRVRLLLQSKQDIRAEQERVEHFIDTSSVEDRLKDHKLPSIEQQKSPTDKPNQGHMSSF